MSQVVFRRIGGRIVPIKMTNKQRGSAEIAAGVGVGVGSGIIGGRMSKKADRFTVVADNAHNLAMKLFDISLKTKSVSAKKHLIDQAVKADEVDVAAGKLSRSLFKQSFRIQQLGALGAGALVGAGVNRILGDTKHKDSKYRTEASAAAGAATGFAVQQLHHSIGGGLTFSQGLKRFARQAAKKAVKFAGKIR